MKVQPPHLVTEDDDVGIRGILRCDHTAEHRVSVEHRE
jgi:hypothetical protein